MFSSASTRAAQSYLRILIPLLFLTCLPAVDASASPSTLLGAPILHFSRDAPPPGFTLLTGNSITMEGTSLLADVSRIAEGSGSDEEEQTIDLRIGLVSNDIAGLEKAVREISTPGSARYQKYLTDDEVDSYISPSNETKTLFSDWLSSHNLSSTNTSPLTPAGEWVIIPSHPIKKANQMLNADYKTYVHQGTGRTAVRTLQYSVPQNLKSHVEGVHPGGSFDFGSLGGDGMEKKAGGGNVQVEGGLGLYYAGWGTGGIGLGWGNRRRRRRGENPTPDASASVTASSPSSSSSSSVPPAPPPSSANSSCATLLTPTCIQQLYNVPSEPARHSKSGNGLFVTGFGNEFAELADLSQYLSLLRTDIPSSTSFNLRTIDDGINPQNSSAGGDEANLDIQLTVGVATGVPVTFLSVGEGGGSSKFDGLGAFLDVSHYLLGGEFRGGGKRPSVVTTSYGFNEPDLDPDVMRKLCYSYLQLSALGTSIIFSSGDGGVSGNFNTQCPDQGRFVPSFPSTCPYVTSVGGTTAATGSLGSFPEETALFFSSGGFSDVFDRPWWQEDEVEDYLRVLGGNYTGQFNPGGRGFPDVSAYGSDVPIISNGERIKIGGTSTSAPIFASIVALLNDRLIAKGKPTLGLLNPMIYASRTEREGAWRDVKSGSNPGCNTTGFGAAQGWDPVTGVGSPDFEGLVRAIGA